MAKQLFRKTGTWIWNLSRDHVVDCASERINITACVNAVRLAGLLGGDVIKRPYGRAVARHAVGFAQIDGEAQVGELRLPIARDEDVVGVHIAMDQSLTLGVFKPERHLAHEGGGDGGWNRAVFRHHLANVFPLDEFHHEVTLSGRLPFVVNPHEVVVLKLRTDDRLTVKPGDGTWVVDPFRRQDLDRNPPIETSIAAR